MSLADYTNLLRSFAPGFSPSLLPTLSRLIASKEKTVRPCQLNFAPGGLRSLSCNSVLHRRRDAHMLGAEEWQRSSGLLLPHVLPLDAVVCHASVGECCAVEREASAEGQSAARNPSRAQFLNSGKRQGKAFDNDDPYRRSRPLNTPS